MVLSGLGDHENKELNNMTPLEAASTPNLDFLGSRGEFGLFYPVKAGIIPESHHSLLSLFGNAPHSASRGQLEAKGSGLNLKHGDLALRTNFSTVDNFDEANIIDRRAGRTLTTPEAIALATAINIGVKLKHKFHFRITQNHRGILVIRGGLSDNISSNDLFYDKDKKHANKFLLTRALDEDVDSEFSADVVNSFLKQAYDILDGHPVNEARRRAGLFPANYISFRGAGSTLPKLKQYKKWAAIVYTPLEKGIADFSGMRIFSFEYPRMKNYNVYDNVFDGLNAAVNFTKDSLNWGMKEDYIYVHIKETDIPSHDGRAVVKKEMIEIIDRDLFSFLKNFVQQNNLPLIVTGDHTTSSVMKDHSHEPLPLLYYSNHPEKEIIKFSEKNSANGSLGSIYGHDLLKRTGFVDED